MQKLKIRKPVVAGQFYCASAKELKDEIAPLFNKKAAKINIISCMLPHAGYMYSGRVAAETVSRINIKDKIILLGPNHTGNGAAFSLMSEGSWETPLGMVKIDAKLAQEILNNSKHLEEDVIAHINEHSLEVELPFLQYAKDNFEIVPITISASNTAVLKRIGEDIAKAILASPKKDSIMVVASSDMTHYEPQAQAEKKDKEAIRAILDLDEDKLMKCIREMNITMCGYAPVVVMITISKLLGAKRGKLVKYQTSGDITGDKKSVVGYAGIIIY